MLSPPYADKRARARAKEIPFRITKNLINVPRDSISLFAIVYHRFRLNDRPRRTFVSRYSYLSHCLSFAGKFRYVPSFVNARVYSP